MCIYLLYILIIYYLNYIVYISDLINHKWISFARKNKLKKNNIINFLGLLQVVMATDYWAIYVLQWKLQFKNLIDIKLKIKIFLVQIIFWNLGVWRSNC